jgi:hypothetical protein
VPEASTATLGLLPAFDTVNALAAAGPAMTSAASSERGTAQIRSMSIEVPGAAKVAVIRARAKAT